MDGVVEENMTSPFARTQPQLTSNGTSGVADIIRRTLALGAGGSGILFTTEMKARHVARYGKVHDSAKFLGFDVVDSPPLVTLHRDDVLPIGPRPVTVRLEQGTEYCRIGEGCIPTRLSHVLKTNPHLNPGLRKLLERQPGNRFTKSLENGTEGERLYGLLAFHWSLAEVRNLIVAALKELNDLRLPGEGRDPAAVSTMAILVVIAASFAGGVGSAIALPLCGEVKRAMNQLGMDVNQSLFLGVCFTPECFPESTLRLSNTYETLADYSVAQKEGVIP
jgi:hypothetical protein